MMDALSAPRLPASDGAVGQPATARPEGAKEDSFSRVLSASGQKQRGGRDDKAAPEKTPNADSAEIEVATKSSGKDKQVLIEIGGMLPADLEGLPADLSVDDLAKLLAAAKPQSKGDASNSSAPRVDFQDLDPGLQVQLAKAIVASRERTGPVESGQVPAEQGRKGVTKEEATLADLGDVEKLLSDADGQSVPANDQRDVLNLLAAVDGPKSIVDDQRMGVEANAKDDHKQAMVETLKVAVSAVAEEGADASTADQGRGEGDRDFRFIRADGKGQPLLLQSDTAPRTQSAEPVAVETVTVVDSRRYIAPVSTTNGASITAAMLGDGEWLSAMSPGSELANAAAHSSQGKVVHTLKIQMSPIELGSVTATLRLSGEELSVQLTVDNPAALRQLQNDQSDILKALKGQGLIVDQVQVNMQVASADRGADTGQNAASNQQSGQQASQFAHQGGNERQQRREPADNGVRVADDRTVQNSEVPGTDSRGARPDQLYL